MIDVKNTRIESISALIGPSCNLQCSYCEMAKNTQPEDKKELIEKTIKALENGDFIKNIEKTLKRLHQSCHHIFHLEFWGQESTLFFPYLEKSWDLWAQKLYNLESLFFSTNGMTNSDIIFNFLKKIDKIAKKPIRIGIQISYDGIYGEKEIRGGNDEYILENFIKFQEKVNNYNFRYIEIIELNTHAVMSMELIKHLDSIYKVENYFDEYEKFLNILYSHNRSKIIQWKPAAFLGQNCHSASRDEGIKYNFFTDMVNELKQKKDYPLTLNVINKHENFAFALCGYGADDIKENIKKGQYKNFNDFVDSFINCDLDHPYHKNAITCSASLGELKIMYDGTILQCQNLMFDTKMDIKLIKNNVNDWGRYYFLNKGQKINGLTSSDEEINTYFQYMRDLQSPSRILFTMSSIYNLMFLLVRLGQINSSYYDNEKIKRHSLLLTRILNCPYNCQVLSGSTFLRQSGEIRQFCNGLLDKIEQVINETMEKKNV